MGRGAAAVSRAHDGAAGHGPTRDDHRDRVTRSGARPGAHPAAARLGEGDRRHLAQVSSGDPDERARRGGALAGARLLAVDGGRMGAGGEGGGARGEQHRGRRA